MAADDHPKPKILDRLLTGGLGAAELRRVVAHVAAPCAVCQESLRGLLDAAPRYGRAVARARVAVAPGLDGIREAQLRAMALWAILDGTPAERRVGLVEGDARFHLWELAARCLEAAADRPWQDARRSVLGCRVALVIAERLPAAAYTAALRQDLVARALGGLAEAQRLAVDLAAAWATLRRAQGALLRGTGHPLERAGLLRVEANLRLDEGNTAGAAALLRPPVAIYRRFGEVELEGRAVLKLARVVGHENPALGATLARRAVALSDAVREPAAALGARHALVWFLNDCGLAERALAELGRARPLYLACRDTEPNLMLGWLEARICRRLGELGAAERGLVAAWREFEAAGFRRELTLVSLDLAETYLAQGRRRQAVRLLRMFQGKLGSFPLHAEGMAAWGLLVEAAAWAGAAGVVTGETVGEAVGARAEGLVRELGIYFRRAWVRPAVFRPAGAR